MNLDNFLPIPIPLFKEIQKETNDIGFNMSSDVLTGSLLQTLATTKPSGKFLELGTGTGLSTVWILNGMDRLSSIISIDNNVQFQQVAKKYLDLDQRLHLLLEDCEEWVEENKDEKFDFIFADTWCGKYRKLYEVLSMVSIGGLYIVDDLLPQSNWPDGHEKKVNDFIEYMQGRKDFRVTIQNWATGIMIACRVF